MLRASRWIEAAQAVSDEGASLGLPPTDLACEFADTIAAGCVHPRALSLLSRAILFVAGFVYIDARFECDESAPIAGIVSNHISWADVLIHCWLFSPSFVAAHYVRNAPIVGKMSTAMKCIFVNRDTAGGTGVSGQIRDRMAATMRDESVPPVVVFAEGTTTNGSYLLPFKKGAFIAALPLKMATIRYEWAGSGSVSPAWESIGALRHILLMLCTLTHSASVTIERIEPDGGNVGSAGEGAGGGPGGGPEAYASKCRERMLARASFKPSGSSWKDKQEYHRKLLAAIDGTKQK